MSKSYYEIIRETYKLGREPGGYLRWLEWGPGQLQQQEARREREAAESRAQMAWLLNCRVHPDQVVHLTHYKVGTDDSDADHTAAGQGLDETSVGSR